jgi:hypothetical protein
MFISVKFNAADYHAYTYIYDGDEQLSPGDFVVVETKDGRKPVTVHEVDVSEPPFRCKPIIAILIEKEV